MSAQIMDGGPAFPREEMRVTGLAVQPVQPGMSLRDWFAAHALAGMLANPSHEGLPAEDWAHDAYMHADAMLAARAKGEA